MSGLIQELISWRARWRAYEYMRNSLWIVPLACIVLAVAAGYGLPEVDRHLRSTIGIVFTPEAARSVLGAIASGMITFTGFVFSILLLAVQFGSTQFSPRMLRRFLRDPSTKAALGVFMATFSYALLVLRVIGTGAGGAYVPSNSVAVALVLLLASMLLFLRLVSRTTQGLRVAVVVGELGRDLGRIVDRVYPEPTGSSDVPWRPEFPAPARTVTYRGQPGVIQSVGFANLVERARAADAMIEMIPRFGDFIADGSPLLKVHGDRGSIDDRWLRGTVATGDERTMRQDPAFGFRLLADISARALSPGVNDPTTAVQVLDQIELLLRKLGSRRLVPGIRRDSEGTVRFAYAAPSWEDYLSLALDETRLYGQGSVQVMRRLRALLESLRESLPGSRHSAVDAELALLDSAVARVYSDQADQRAAALGDRQGLGATMLPRQASPGFGAPERGLSAVAVPVFVSARRQRIAVAAAAAARRGAAGQVARSRAPENVIRGR
ncbi:MAG: DUF2254 domain-containing protein [Trebonia sp.]